MRTNWLLGVALGVFIGGFALVVGVLALLAAVPALVWAFRSRSRAISVSGLLVGFGGGLLGLIGLAQLRCTNVTGPNYGSFCEPPDLTGYVAFAAVLVAVGLALGLTAVRRSMNHT